MATLKDYSGYVDSEYLKMLAQMSKQVKQRTYELLQIEPGHKVLDVGCGPATDTINLAPLVGSRGEVIGVDFDREMIEQGNQKAKKANLEQWVRHQQADAVSLPFKDSYFDSCRSDRLFQHLLEPERVLAEMTRVTKSGGWLVVVDTDHATLSVDTSEVDLERRLMRINVEKRLNNAFSGRQLYRQFKQQGLGEISFELFPIAVTNYQTLRKSARFEQLESLALEIGAITPQELERWRMSLESAAAEGTLFASATQILVAGCKP